jgi:AraC-like DNA-binding protein
MDMDGMIKVMKAIEYINNHLENEDILEDSAEFIGVSISHYTFLFKSILGYTPAEYIRKRRLNISTKSIINKEKVIDIAIESGYGSSEAYTRAFKKEFGVAPIDYQKYSVSCPIDELDDFEKIIAFFPAPAHKEYFGHLYYEEYKEVYDRLADKGYFKKETLEYSFWAKQLTEKYSYDFEYLIAKLAHSTKTMDELYDTILKSRYLPRILFDMLVSEMKENGMLEGTIFEQGIIENELDFLPDKFKVAHDQMKRLQSESCFSKQFL